jgi:hypothetical protein
MHSFDSPPAAGREARSQGEQRTKSSATNCISSALVFLRGHHGNYKRMWASLLHARQKTKKKRESHTDMGSAHDGRISHARFSFHAATLSGGSRSIAMSVLLISSSAMLIMKAATPIRITATRISPIKTKHDTNFDRGERVALGDIVGAIVSEIGVFKATLSQIVLLCRTSKSTPPAGASFDHGVEVETTENHVNRAADGGCMSRLVRCLTFGDRLRHAEYFHSKTHSVSPTIA